MISINRSIFFPLIVILFFIPWINSTTFDSIERRVTVVVSKTMFCLCLLSYSCILICITCLTCNPFQFESKSKFPPQRSNESYSDTPKLIDYSLMFKWRQLWASTLLYLSDCCRPLSHSVHYIVGVVGLSLIVLTHSQSPINSQFI